MNASARARTALFALALIAGARSARADEGQNPGPVPPAIEVKKPKAQALPPDAAAPDPAPAIAKPAPDAPKEKVDKAKETAKAAQLTPLEPSPKNPLQPAFQLYLEIDLPVLALAGVFGTARIVKTSPAYCAPLCDPSTLNAIDRLTAGYYKPGWSTASTYGLYGTIAAAAAVLAIDEGPLDALNDAVVVAESALSSTAAASILTVAEGRPRPYLYGTTAPLSVRSGADASLSFISSHTCVTGALAMSMFMTMRRLYPDTKIPAITIAIGSAATLFVAIARVEGGDHFISDVLGGALVGGAFGMLIPALHGSPVRLVPVAGNTQKGVSVGGTF